MAELLEILCRSLFLLFCFNWLRVATPCVPATAMQRRHRLHDRAARYQASSSGTVEWIGSLPVAQQHRKARREPTWSPLASVRCEHARPLPMFDVAHHMAQRSSDAEGHGEALVRRDRPKGSQLARLDFLARGYSQASRTHTMPTSSPREYPRKFSSSARRTA